MKEEQTSFNQKRKTMINTRPVERLRLLWSERLDDAQKKKIKKIIKEKFQQFKEGECFDIPVSTLVYKKSNLYKKGIEAAEDGKYDKALSFYLKALPHTKFTGDEYIALSYDMGSAYSQQCNYKDAFNFLTRHRDVWPV